MLFEVRYLRRADGVDIAYAVMGAGPAIVFLPDNGLPLAVATIPAYRPFFERLAARHTLVLYDPQGSGLSGGECAEAVLDSFTRDLPDVLKQSRIGRYSLLSRGPNCAVAVRYAGDAPPELDALILVNPMLRYRDQVEHGISGGLIAVARDDPGSYYETALSMYGPLDAPSRARYEALLPRIRPFWLAAAQPLAQLDALRLASRVRVPSLVICDEVLQLTSQRILRESAAAIPGARIVSVHHGRGIYFDDTTGQFIEPIERFLEPIEEAWSVAGQAVTNPIPGLTGSDPVGSPGLSSRELEVLALLATGRTNAQIADALVISEHTVIRHVYHIMAKLEVSNRTEAASWAIRSGLARD